MPRITEFDGFTLFINHSDHPPPHFHIRGNDHHDRISIEDGRPMDSSCRLSATLRRRLAKWTAQHRAELLDDWDRAQQHERLVRIDPPG